MDRRSFIGSMTALGFLGISGKIGASTLDKLSDKPERNSKRFDDDFVVFISDLHCNPDGYQPEKLKKVVSEILAMKPLPKNVIALGDLAYLTGKEREYAGLKPILAPIEEAGINLTLAMGNHDRREQFAEAFPEIASRTNVPGRFVYKVETEKAGFIVLDSLNQGEDTTKWITPGTMDEAQLQWLKTTLESYDKPVFVCSHHPVNELPGVLPVLLSSKACCGYIYGHCHVWRPGWFESWGADRVLCNLCLPSTGHWGDIGYVKFKMNDSFAQADLVQSEFFFTAPVEDSDVPEQWKMMTESHQGASFKFSFESFKKK